MKWSELNLPVSILETHPDCATYLVETGFVYPLTGYANSTDCEEIHTIRLEGDHPLLKIEGDWRRWDEIKPLLTDKEIRWSYISPEGFVPQDRLHYTQIYPVHYLSAKQYERIRAIALRFLENPLEIDEAEDNDCILQLMTSSDTKTSSPFYLEHCTLRLIRPNEEGKIEVYSFGSEMSEDQFKQLIPNGSWLNPSILKTVRTQIGMCDFKEFREMDTCRVTMIPLTTKRANRIIDRVNLLSQSRLRFNYIQQNCFALAHEVLKEAGYEMPDIRMTFGRLLSWRLVNREGIFARILEYDSYISRVASNCLVYLLGGGKTSLPLKGEEREEPLSQGSGMITFSRLIRSPMDLIKQESGWIHHSLPFIQWQLEQPSTVVIYPERGVPKMHGL